MKFPSHFAAIALALGAAVVFAEPVSWRGRDGYGGGGGRIAIRRRIDNDPTPTAERTYVSAVAGGLNGRASVLPTDGTVYWGRWNNGFSVIVR